MQSIFFFIIPWFTFMHLADAFIQSDFRLYIYCQYVCSLGIEPTTFCAANAMLYHWATGTPDLLLLSMLKTNLLLHILC